MSIRNLLYFTLGSVPPILFSLRFLVQWIASERKKKSVVGPLFWKISLCANSLFALHYFVQFQFPFFLIQSVSAFIAWRNINFLQTKKPPKSLKIALTILLVIITCGITAYFLQTKILGNHSAESRFEDAPFIWHLIGTLGISLFAARFWIQWWQMEKAGISRVNSSFWICSIVGSLLGLCYFLRIGDYMSMITYSFGTIPYLRNLILIKKAAKIT